MTKKHKNDLPQLIRRYFGEYLPLQRSCSPNTIEAYGGTFSLLLKYFQSERKVVPSKISIDDMTTENILGFLNHLQKERGNGASTRNARLAAIHSFIRYVLMEKPIWAGSLQGILAIPQKRTQKNVLGFLSEHEMQAVIDAPNDQTWCGRRDRTLFAVMYNTGARVSEIVNLRVFDVKLGKTGTINLFGKGRKERVIPLWKSTISILRKWIESNKYSGNDPLFPNNRGAKMTRSAIAKQLDSAVSLAIPKCRSLKSHSISPHTIRHSTAMRFLQAGMDITVIAMWLGHESIETTHAYISADIALKEEALRSLHDPKPREFRFHPSDDLLAYLDNL